MREYHAAGLSEIRIARRAKIIDFIYNKRFSMSSVDCAKYALTRADSADVKFLLLYIK